VFVIGTIFLCTALSVVAYCDIRWRRIPNPLNLLIGLTGLLNQTLWGGWVGFKSAWLGAIAGGAIFLTLYLFKWMGAGDVKLVAAVGTWLGLERIFWGLYFIVLIGGVLALVLLMRSRIGVPRQAMNQQAGTEASPASEGKECMMSQPVTVPYGLAIVVGSLLVFLRIV
jgi:prepilin peptidase CpaA